MTDIFLSSNGYGNDYLKSGPRWSEQPGPPHTVAFHFHKAGAQHPVVFDKYLTKTRERDAFLVGLGK
jgi:hypothetical protein